MMTFNNLFFYAKGSSGGSGGGGGGGGSKSVAKHTYTGSAGGIRGISPISKPTISSTSSSTKEKGDSVTQVRRNETYEIYSIQNGKEKYEKDRPGSVILEKMHYDKSRGAWISYKQGRKYVVRKKKN